MAAGVPVVGESDGGGGEFPGQRAPAPLEHHETRGARGFRHETLFYVGAADFLASVCPFVLEAVAADEPILVAVPPWNSGPLRASLGADADRVEFADMSAIGRNPARIIPAWRDFLARSAQRGRTVRGVGEPIWQGRSHAELDECERHESLLNAAFGEDDFWLLCPYDVEALARPCVEGALRRHPYVRIGGSSVANRHFSAEGAADVLRGPLPRRPAGSRAIGFGIGDLGALRLMVAASARDAGVSEDRVSALVMAANEVATNSVLHGGGRGTFAVWSTDETVQCEIRDAGVMTDPLLGRGRAEAEDEGGRGLWLAHQLCDLVQIRSTRTGTVVRMHVEAG